VRLPPEISLRDAALVEPVAVAVHDVRRSGLAAGDKAVVIGAGPIGVLIAIVAASFGAEVVIAEIDPTRRAAAEEMGLTTLDPSTVDQVAWVEEWTAGAGADVVFEVSGSAAAVLGATSLAKVRGTLVVVAIHSQPPAIDLHRVFWRELRLLGARVYQRRDFERAIGLLTEGAIPAEKFITGIVPLSGLESAFGVLEAGQAMKLLVEVSVS
jgi:2-desacetyl-2-hydroxyethyl bacteriochlorophyllide A dehydrogenase